MPSVGNWNVDLAKAQHGKQYQVWLGEKPKFRLIIYWGDEKGNNTEMASGNSEALEKKK